MEKGSGSVNRLMLVRIQSSALNVSMVQRIALDSPNVQIQVRVLVETLALRVYRSARQTTNLQDGVRFLGGALTVMSSECAG